MAAVLTASPSTSLASNEQFEERMLSKARERSLSNVTTPQSNPVIKSPEARIMSLHETPGTLPASGDHLPAFYDNPPVASTSTLGPSPPASYNMINTVHLSRCPSPGPSVAELEQLGIKVRDFVHELPPFIRAKPPVQVAIRPSRELRRVHDSIFLMRGNDPTVHCPPISHRIRDAVDISGFESFSQPTTSIEIQRIEEIRNQWKLPSSSKHISHSPSLLCSSSQPQSRLPQLDLELSSHDPVDYEYVKTPLVTPNGSLRLLDDEYPDDIDAGVQETSGPLDIAAVVNSSSSPNAYSASTIEFPQQQEILKKRAASEALVDNPSSSPKRARQEVQPSSSFGTPRHMARAYSCPSPATHTSTPTKRRGTHRRSSAVSPPKGTTLPSLHV